MDLLVVNQMEVEKVALYHSGPRTYSFNAGDGGIWGGGGGSYMNIDLYRISIVPTQIKSNGGNVNRNGYGGGGGTRCWGHYSGDAPGGADSVWIMAHGGNGGSKGGGGGGCWANTPLSSGGYDARGYCRYANAGLATNSMCGDGAGWSSSSPDDDYTPDKLPENGTNTIGWTNVFNDGNGYFTGAGLKGSSSWGGGGGFGGNGGGGNGGGGGGYGSNGGSTGGGGGGYGGDGGSYGGGGGGFGKSAKGGNYGGGGGGYYGRGGNWGGGGGSYGNGGDGSSSGASKGTDGEFGGGGGAGANGGSGIVIVSYYQ